MFSENFILYKDIKEIDNLINDYCIITTKNIYNIFKEKLNILNGEVVFIEDLDKKEINKDLVAFGAGSIIDKTKVLSQKNKVDYSVIPTTISNDGICDSIAILENDKHLICKLPKHIIFDISILEKSPLKLLKSGYLDVIANKNALEDCEYAEKNNLDKNNSLSKVFSETSYKLLENIKKIDNSQEFIKTISHSVILSGLSEYLNKKTNTMSGSEHLIAHAIDFIYPNNNLLHGYKVGYGCLLIEELFKKNYYKKLFKKLKIYKEIKEEFKFIDKKEIIKKAIEIGNNQNKPTRLLEIKY